MFSRRDGSQFLYLPDLRAAVDEDGVHYVDFAPDTFIKNNDTYETVDIPDSMAKLFKSMYYRRFSPASVVPVATVTTPVVQSSALPSIGSTFNQSLSPLTYVPRQ